MSRNDCLCLVLARGIPARIIQKHFLETVQRQHFAVYRPMSLLSLSLSALL